MTMDKLVALNFLPQEQLNLAYSHEKNELHRYRWLALSFLPIDPPVSRLMKMISMECVQRLRNVQDVAKMMDLVACTEELPIKKPPPFFNKNRQHFFVVDEPMGRKFLERAEEAAQETYVFFDWLLETNATPELHQLLFRFVTQKKNEHSIIKECREQWKIGFSEPVARYRN